MYKVWLEAKPSDAPIVASVAQIVADFEIASTVVAKSDVIISLASRVDG